MVTLEEWLGFIILGPWRAFLIGLESSVLAATFPLKFLHSIVTWQKPKTFKSILITGASSGLGAEFARQYAAPGVRLVLLARRVAKLDEIKRLCESLGAKVETVVADVTDEKGMAKAIQAADDRAPLDLVIANAGLHPASVQTHAPLVDTPIPVTNCDVMGICYTVSPILQRMQDRKSGQIAIMSSISAYVQLGDPWWFSYGAAKAWAKSFGMGLRKALRGSGVGVTVLCPGVIVSELYDDVISSGIGLFSRLWMHPWSPGAPLDPVVAVRRMRVAISRDVGVFTTPGWLLAAMTPIMYNVMPPLIWNVFPEMISTKAGATGTKKR